MTTAAPVQPLFDLPDTIELAEFTLVIVGKDTPSGDELAKRIRESISAEFAKRAPLLSLVYDLVIEESDVRRSERKGKEKVKLKKKVKKGMTFLEKVSFGMGGAGLVIGIVAADPIVVGHNVEWACEHAIHICKSQGDDVRIEGMNIYPWEGFPQRRKPPTDQA